MSDDFAEKYEGKLNDFISFISDETLAVPGTYKATWRFIEKEKHSLERHSNMHLIFCKMNHEVIWVEDFSVNEIVIPFIMVYNHIYKN